MTTRHRKLPIRAATQLARISWCVVKRRAFSRRTEKGGLTPNDFPNLHALEEMLLDFQAYYETIARPFAWQFTRTDLDQLLVKLARHEQHQHKAVASAAA